MFLFYLLQTPLIYIRRLILPVCILLLLTTPLKASPHYEDSLEVLLSKTTEDSSRAQLLYKLAWNQTMNGKITKARKNTLELLHLASQNHLEILEANGINLLGITYQIESNNFEALKQYIRSLELHKKLGNKPGIAFSSQSIGAIYSTQSRFNESEPYYLIALRIYRELADTNGICNIYQNLGNNYSMQGRYALAMKNFKAALYLRERFSQRNGVAINLVDIGLCQQKQGDLVSARNAFEKALAVATAYGKHYIAVRAMLGLVNNYLQEKNYAKVAQFLESARLILKNNQVHEIRKEFYQLAYQFDSIQGKWKNALNHYQLYRIYSDSINDEKVARQTLETQLRYEFEKMEQEREAEQHQKDALQELGRKRQVFIRNTLSFGLLMTLIFLTLLYRQRNHVKRQNVRIEKEKHRSDELLLNILPAPVAEELKNHGKAEARMFDSVTVLFTDFTNFTQFSATVTPTELVGIIHECFSAFDQIMLRHGVEKIKTIGDAYMAAGGLPQPNETHASDVILAAIEIQEFLKDHQIQRVANGLPFLEARIGIHTGPVIAGIVGLKKFAYDIWGDTVNTASRLENLGEATRINISGETYNRVQNQFHCHFRGRIEAKGKGELEMYFVESEIT